ncbi:hypothetical protein BGZ98_004981, partial [Dissophora globulifera]
QRERIGAVLQDLLSYEILDESLIITTVSYKSSLLYSIHHQPFNIRKYARGDPAIEEML